MGAGRSEDVRSVRTSVGGAELASLPSDARERWQEILVALSSLAVSLVTSFAAEAIINVDGVWAGDQDPSWLVWSATAILSSLAGIAAVFWSVYRLRVRRREEDRALSMRVAIHEQSLFETIRHDVAKLVARETAS